MTVTQDQQIALDFYAVWEQQVKYFGLTILPEREDRLLFRKGKKLMEAALTLKGKGSHTKYTQEEAEFIVLSYINSNADRHVAMKAFFTAFPETTHSTNSVWMKLSRVRTLDSQFDNDTEWQIDQQLVDICQRIDSDRFSV